MTAVAITLIIVVCNCTPITRLFLDPHTKPRQSSHYEDTHRPASIVLQLQHTPVKPTANLRYASDEEGDQNEGFVIYPPRQIASSRSR